MEKQSKTKIKIAYETKSKLQMLKEYEDQVYKFPKNFRKAWDLIEQMRKKSEAPVDSMGVSYCPDNKAERTTFKFQSLVSLLLSSQTKDPITFAVMKKLIDHGLTIDNIINTEESDIRDMIYGVSFYNNKAKFIKSLAEKLKEEHNSDPPETLEEILKLPGIGHKMAFLYLQSCCNKIEGIAVDTHVHRISNRLEWVKETSTPEKTRLELEKWLPKEKWGEINDLLVGFGQTICKAVAPVCESCLVKDYCNFGKQRLKEKQSKSRSKSKSLKRKNEIEETVNKKRKR